MSKIIYNQSFLFLVSFFFCFSKVCPTSLLIPDEHGWAYLIRVVNRTNFPGKLEFQGSGAGIDPFIIPAGQDLGDPINSTEETVGTFVAPVGALRKTRIWHGGSAITKEKDTRVDKLPTVCGAGIKDISQFDASKILMLQPMQDSAIAWLAQQDLTGVQNPKLNMTISFMVYVQDKGDVSLLFSEKESIGPDWVWKVSFSTESSGGVKILKNNAGVAQEVASVLSSGVPVARIIPGKFTRFWVSLRSNQIVVGQGEDGQNPLAVWEEEIASPRQIKRLGFSCSDSPISIARVMTAAGVFPAVLDSPIATLSADKLKSSEVVLREPGSGAFSFSRDSEPISLEFLSSSSKAEDKVRMDFVADSVEIKLVTKDGEKDTSKFNLKPNQENLWLSLKDEQLIFGSGPLSKDGFLSGIYLNQFLKDVDKVKFVSSPKNGALLFSRAKLSTTAWDSSFSEKLMFSGNVKIYQPFQYQFDQKGPSITGMDMIYKKSYILGKAPQQGAVYPFELVIESDATPVLDWHNKAVNVGKFFINVAAMTLRISEAAAYMQASKVTDEDTDEVKVDLKLTAKNVGISLGGGAMGAMAALLEAEADSGYRDEAAYGIVERASVVTGRTDSEKIKSLADVQTNFSILFEKIKGLNFRTKEDLDYAMQLYTDLLALIKDPGIISDDQRTKLVDDLSQIAVSAGVLYENPKMVAGKIIRIVIDALLNRALFDRSKLKHKKLSDNLNTILQGLFSKLLFEIGREKISIPNFAGNFLWTGKSFQDGGSIFLQAKGSSGLFVHLLRVADQNFESKIGQISWLEPGSRVYEIGLGIDRNTRSCIRVSRGGRSLQEVLSSKNSQVGMTNFSYKPFWVSFSNNTVSVGQGSWGDGKFLEWTDPYPASGKIIVGLSGQAGIIEATDIRVGPPVESFVSTLDGKIVKTIPEKTDDELDREKKIADKKASTGLSQITQDKSLELAKAKSPLEANLLNDTNQLVGYDQLGNLADELEFGPLFSELEYDKYKRDQKEQGIADKVIEKQSSNNSLKLTSDDAEARQAAADAADTRAARGSVQRAGGMFGAMQEFKTFGGDLKAAGKGLKNTGNAILNIGRKTSVATAKTADRIEEGSKKENEGSVMTGEDHADAAATRTSRLRQNQDRADSGQVVARPESITPPNRQDENDANSPKSKKEADSESEKKDSGSSAFWETSIGQDVRNAGKIGDAVVSGKFKKDIGTIPTKFVHEFDLKKSKEIQPDFVPRPQSGPIVGGAAESLTKDEESGPDHIDDWKKGTRSFDASMAIAKTKSDSLEAEKQLKKVSQDLDAEKTKLAGLPDGEEKVRVQKQVDDLTAKQTDAQSVSQRAKEVAEKTYYHGNATLVGKAREKYDQAKADLEKINQDKAVLEQKLLASPADKKLKDELDKLKSKATDAEKKVDKEKTSMDRQIDDIFDQYGSRVAAIGQNRREIDSLKEKVAKAKADLESGGGSDLAEKLAYARKELADAKDWSEKLSVYTDDDAALILKAKKLDDEDRDGLPHDQKLTPKEIKKIREAAEKARSNYEYVGRLKNPVANKISGIAANVGEGLGMAIVSGNQSEATPEEVAAQEAAKAQALQLGTQTNFSSN